MNTRLGSPAQPGIIPQPTRTQGNRKPGARGAMQVCEAAPVDAQGIHGVGPAASRQAGAAGHLSCPPSGGGWRRRRGARRGGGQAGKGALGRANPLPRQPAGRLAQGDTGGRRSLGCCAGLCGGGGKAGLRRGAATHSGQVAHPQRKRPVSGRAERPWVALACREHSAALPTNNFF